MRREWHVGLMENFHMGKGGGRRSAPGPLPLREQMTFLCTPLPLKRAAKK